MVNLEYRYLKDFNSFKNRYICDILHCCIGRFESTSLMVIVVTLFYYNFTILGDIVLYDQSDKLIWSGQVTHQLFALNKLNLMVILQIKVVYDVSNNVSSLSNLLK